MTLLHMDGFELGDGALRYGTGSGIGTGTTSSRLSYGRYLTILNTNCPKTVTASSEVFVGIAIKNPGTGNAFITFLGDTGATSHITILCNPDGSFTIRRGNTGGTVLATAPIGTLSATDWTYVEARVTISDTVGVVDVRLNGSTTAVLSFSGDTKNAGTNTTIDRVTIGQSGGSTAAQFDDWYVLNTSGSVNNTWAGDVRVVTLAPNGNGNYSQFVGSDGNSTDNYLLVDEQPYSTTDYVGSPTSGNRDTYLMEDLPGGVATVYAVQEVAIAAKSDAGAASIKQSLRISGTDYETSAVALGTAYATITNIRETNPNTAAAWTPSGVNGTEAGVRVA